MIRMRVPLAISIVDVTAARVAAFWFLRHVSFSKLRPAFAPVPLWLTPAPCGEPRSRLPPQALGGLGSHPAAARAVAPRASTSKSPTLW